MNVNPNSTRELSNYEKAKNSLIEDCSKCCKLYEKSDKLFSSRFNIYNESTNKQLKKLKKYSCNRFNEKLPCSYYENNAFFPLQCSLSDLSDMKMNPEIKKQKCKEAVEAILSQETKTN